ncbi:Uncharacterized protein OBRU01_07327 [Operophtera brumata]|uniref:Uncharacterized protein n=1 Tax=Operophtera brumata TaxID=104452 RepID=A0A0L7LJD1_OPEBR|nr:Uncharacterized protein OBRU01_07327 [Operophtera brumata]
MKRLVFTALESYQVNASPVPQGRYPWIARVVHSTQADVPHVCTASCVHDGLFITAASCIIGLSVRAFVIPSNGTKQAFDDIAFIVVQQTDVPWSVVKLFHEKNRTDAVFQWFEDMGASEYKVVGYATKKGIHRIKSADRVYNLTELKVFIGLEICATILTFQKKASVGFNIPCYHSCTLKEFQQANKTGKCSNYHGVDGGAVFDVKKGHLLGVATWGAYFSAFKRRGVARSYASRAVRGDADRLNTNASLLV